jgi:hypothetical protein
VAAWLLIFGIEGPVNIYSSSAAASWLACCIAATLFSGVAAYGGLWRQPAGWWQPILQRILCIWRENKWYLLANVIGLGQRRQWL